MLRAATEIVHSSAHRRTTGTARISATPQPPAGQFTSAPIFSGAPVDGWRRSDFTSTTAAEGRVFSASPEIKKKSYDLVCIRTHSILEEFIFWMSIIVVRKAKKKRENDTGSCVTCHLLAYRTLYCNFAWLANFHRLFAVRSVHPVALIPLRAHPPPPQHSAAQHIHNSAPIE